MEKHVNLPVMVQGFSSNPFPFFPLPFQPFSSLPLATFQFSNNYTGSQCCVLQLCLEIVCPPGYYWACARSPPQINKVHVRWMLPQGNHPKRCWIAVAVVGNPYRFSKTTLSSFIGLPLNWARGWRPQPIWDLGIWKCWLFMSCFTLPHEDCGCCLTGASSLRKALSFLSQST